ncbi:MAG TPA: flavodoxin [Streptosporangiaceae bacterium]|nr:flavodoxin [Streptosporangiaceae bacterium]
MQVLIVYESIFGNTHLVAGAVERGIRDAAAEAVVNCVPVSRATADLVAAADLLVVGGPTHARGMTIARSRRDAVQGATKEPPTSSAAGDAQEHPLDQDAEGPGLREWFHALPKAGNGRRAAAFDTRLAYWLAGGAAKGIGHRLHKHGYTLAAEPEGFVVEGAEGPLRAGELNRAHDWAAALLRAEVPAG